MGTEGITLQLFVTNHLEPREESCARTLTGSQREIAMPNTGDSTKIFATVQPYVASSTSLQQKVLLKNKDPTFC